jgi:hypothetical protein
MKEQFFDAVLDTLVDDLMSLALDVVVDDLKDINNGDGDDDDYEV